jgi:predicted dehydrogenase
VRQIVQSPRTGKLEQLEVPAPAVGPGQVLVRNHYSVVSPGTEKLALDFARKSLLSKARSRPDLVRQVVRKLRSEGPVSTYRAVTTRLDAPQPLGYACAGIVEEVGPGVTRFAPGDRVACAGAGYANHAEIVAVPDNLVVRVPDSVQLDRAAFATLGAIALQGIRVGEPTLGEIAVVIGLGVIGQLAVQLLLANGCRVAGVDIDGERVKQALNLGASWGFSPDSDLESWIASAAGGYGADLVVVTAASDSSGPIQTAADLCRMRGRVVVVGATAMDLDRRSFYEKELQLRMSMSYGPGRYDRRYEELGLDYPISHVRWTENRNLQAFVDLIASGSLDPLALEAEVVPFDEATRTYEELAAGERRSLVAVFQYTPDRVEAARHIELRARPRAVEGDVGLAFIGAGNYARSVLLPALARVEGIAKHHLITATGASARRSAERFGFASCGTDPQAAIEDPDVDLVFIATTHDLHAAQAVRALRAGKSVWLEKPAALDRDQLAELMDAGRSAPGLLAIGYNRRFSPHAREVHRALTGRATPIALHYSVAAGAPPAGTWYLDPLVGGGRIVGEACHFVDLLTYLVGRPPRSVQAQALGREPENDDSMIASLRFDDGSVATLQYLARASADLPKERFEVSWGGRTLISTDFRELQQVGAKKSSLLNQDKGQRTAVAEVIDAVRSGGPSPFDLSEIEAVSLATFAMLESARLGETVEIRT